VGLDGKMAIIGGKIKIVTCSLGWLSDRVLAHPWFLGLIPSTKKKKKKIIDLA
jgi:hypothetical protein